MREVKGRPLSDWISRTVIMEGERGVVLDIYRGYLVIYFTKGNYICNWSRRVFFLVTIV